ncbi:MAG: thermonuclease family protein [Euryarchaeota archaeon]|nr:thermonuclease family protein [Euryarchaeota archaeon]
MGHGARRLLVLLLLIAAAGAGAVLLYHSPADGGDEELTEGVVERIIDGDTMVVSGFRVRLVGINTPERGEPGYEEAKNFLLELCPPGMVVRLDVDDLEPYDKYGRVLAVVYCNGVNANAELLRRGYAEVMYIPPSEFRPWEWRQ